MPVSIKPLPYLREKDTDRFWSKVDIRGENECWPWTSGLTPRGYGRFSMAPRWFTATRVAFLLTYGSDPYPCYVLHRCDNPPCCNPDHLFLGTHDDNMSDGVSKHRFASGDANGSNTHSIVRPPGLARGERNGHSKLTEETVARIRELWRTGITAPELARMFGVTGACAWQAATGRRWKHLA